MSTRCSEPQRFVRDAISNPETTLLVRGSSHDGAIIRLEGKVLTIGNSPNVKLRLLAKGVKPLHAVLIRGRARTVYRAYDGGVTVNGIPTSEGVIYPGDLLGIGPVRLVFMPADAAKTLGDCDESANTEADLERHSCTSAGLTSRPCHRQEQSERLPKTSLIKEVREPDMPEPGFIDVSTTASATNCASGDVSSTPVRPSAALLPAIMADTVTEMTQFQMEIRTEIERLKEAIADLQTKLAHWEQTTDKRFEELSRAVPQLGSMLEETRRQQSMAEDMLLQVRAEFERLHHMDTELVRRQIDLAAEQTKLDTKAAMLVSREAVLSCSAAPPWEVSSGSPREDDADRWNSGNQVIGTAVEADGPTTNRTTDSSAKGVFVATQTYVDPPLEGESQSDNSWKQGPDKDAKDATIMQQNEPSADGESRGDSQVVHENVTIEKAPPVGSRSNECQQVPDDSGEASQESNQEHQKLVQEYLARLLRRSAGGGHTEGINNEGANNVAASDQSTIAPTLVKEETGATFRRTAGVSRQRRLARRRAGAPEKAKDFAAMRELANLSSQAAIDRYAKAKLRQIRQEKTIVLLVASLCGAALLILHSWIGLGPLGWSALALVFLVILVYGMQYGLLSGRLIINSKGQLQLAERRIGREMRKLIPSSKPSLLEADEARPGDYAESECPGANLLPPVSRAD